MDADSLNKNLLDAIKNAIPSNVNIANFLMDVLLINKEAAYRRIRGQVYFSIYEINILTKKLGLSIDYIVGTTPNENLIYELKSQRYHELREIDYNMFESTYNLVKSIPPDAESEFAVAYNVFPQLPANISYLIGKYNSFRWMYQNQNLYTVKKFSDINYTERQYTTHRAAIDETMNIKNTCYIWDNIIFESIVREIKYFQGIYLITDDEVKSLKKELHQLLFIMEDIAAKGHFITGNKVDIYITNLNSDTSYAYLEAEDIHVSLIGAFVLNYLMSYDKTALEKMKERIFALKRVSTLISGSGELYRMNFFQQQHEFIDTL